MIVVMKRGATPEQIAHMIERVEALGLKSHPIYGWGHGSPSSDRGLWSQK